MSGTHIAGWESDNSQFHARRRALVANRRGAPERLAVLMVESDTDIISDLVDALADQPVEVLAITDPAAALLMVGRTCPDVIVLGPATGRLGAVEFLEVVRDEDVDLPIVVGAGAGNAEFAAQANELGATAIVPRPYRARDLLHMLRSFSPRPERIELRPLVIDLGRLRVDGTVPRFWLDGREVSLPPMEFLILRYFAERVGAVVSRKELVDAVWHDRPPTTSNTLSVHVMRLRKRLGDDEHAPQWIKVLRGLGYQFQVPDATEPPRGVPVQSRNHVDRRKASTA